MSEENEAPHRRFHVIGLNRFEGARVVEAWGVVDTLGMVQQLGVIPDDAPGTLSENAA